MNKSPGLFIQKLREKTQFNYFYSYVWSIIVFFSISIISNNFRHIKKVLGIGNITRWLTLLIYGYKWEILSLFSLQEQVYKQEIKYPQQSVRDNMSYCHTLEIFILYLFIHVRIMILLDYYSMCLSYYIEIVVLIGFGSIKLV